MQEFFSKLSGRTETLEQHLQQLPSVASGEAQRVLQEARHDAIMQGGADMAVTALQRMFHAPLMPVHDLQREWQQAEVFVKRH